LAGSLSVYYCMSKSIVCVVIYIACQLRRAIADLHETCARGAVRPLACVIALRPAVLSWTLTCNRFTFARLQKVTGDFTCRPQPRCINSTCCRRPEQSTWPVALCQTKSRTFPCAQTRLLAETSSSQGASDSNSHIAALSSFFHY